MRERLPGIIEFADIGQFIDAPIRTYSSGMRARLGFSIATAVDPDVLIIDEVLGTGDAVFRVKSQRRVMELAKAAKGIVMVTHDLHWAEEFCNRAMLLEKGQVIAEGKPPEVVALHRERSERGPPRARGRDRPAGRRRSRPDSRAGAPVRLIRSGGTRRRTRARYGSTAVSQL